MYAQRALTVPSLACAPFLAGQPSQKGIPGSATRRKNEGRLGLIDDNRVSGTLEGEGGGGGRVSRLESRRSAPPRVRGGKKRTRGWTRRRERKAWRGRLGRSTYLLPH